MPRHPLAAVLVVTVFALAGCAKPLAAPTARATASSPVVAVGAVVQLDGTPSTDPNTPALPLAFHWRFKSLPAGSQAKLNDASLLTPSFTADVAGAYDVELTVSNAARDSDPTDVEVTAGPCGDNAPRVAGVNASPAAPGVGSVVQLSATATDADTAAPCSLPQTLHYAWRFVLLPPGSHAALNQRDAENPSFVADVAGAYLTELVVTDSTGRSSAPVQLQVNASSCGAGIPSAVLHATPAAPAIAQAVALTAVVTDADNDAPCSAGQTFTYAWSLASAPAGSHATLNSATAVQPSFVPDLPGAYVATLVTTDSTGRASAPATLTVTASTCGANAPSAVLSATPAAPAVAQPVALSAVVTDADNDAPCSAGQTFTYAWSLTSAPAGSHATLNSTTAAQPSFAPDLAGAYVAMLVTTDSTGRKSAPATVTITASGCGANAPSATVVGAPSPSAVGLPVQFTASITDADNGVACQGSTPTQYFTHAWVLLSAPPGSHATLNSTTAAAPSLTPDLPGSYQVRLVVTDSTGLRSVPVDTLAVVGACGANAPAISSVGPSFGSVGQPLSLTAAFSDVDNAAACQALLGVPQTFSYRWAIVSAPAGSRAAIANPTALSAGFTPDATGSYTVAFTVTDSTGRASTSATMVAVDACGANTPVVFPAPDPASTLRVGGTVLLTATVTDEDNGAYCASLGTVHQTFTYHWWVSEAPPGGTTAGANFGVKDLSFSPGANGTYVLGVVATDSTGRASLPAFVPVLVANCGNHAPVAMMSSAIGGACNAGGGGGGNPLCTVTPVVSTPSPPNVLVRAVPVLSGGATNWTDFSLQLDASASYDVDNQAPCSLAEPLSYSWEVIAAPFGGNWSWQPAGGGGGGGGGGGSTATRTTLVNPTLQLFDRGTYLLRLIVSDGAVPSTPIYVTVQTM